MAFPKGGHHTKEAKRKIGLASKGRKHTEESKRKISEANRGKSSWNKGKIAWNRGISMSEEAKEKQRIAHCGPNNSQWIDGRSLKPYSKSWRKIRKIVFKKYNYTCQICNEQFLAKGLYDKNFITAHHIDYNTENNKTSNLIALCNFCNVNVNKNREFWMWFFRDILEKAAQIVSEYQKALDAEHSTILTEIPDRYDLDE